MNRIDFKKQILPHVYVLLAFATLLTIYFSPVVFEKKNIKQSDTVQWSGASHAANQHRETYNEEPLWTNAMFSGMPAYTVTIMFSGEVLEHVEKVLRAGFPHPIASVFIACVAYYILLLSFGMSPLLSAIGAIAFSFFSFTFISLEAGHNSKVRAMSFAPLVLAGMRLAFSRRYILGLATMALGLAFQIRAGHYQITYYVGFIAALYGLSELIFAFKSKEIKPFLIAASVLIVGAGLGVASNAGRILTLQEYTQYSMRGAPELTPKPGTESANKPKDGGLDRDYVFSWSHGVFEGLTIFIPGVVGGSSNEPVDRGSAVYEALRNNNVDPSQVPALPYYWGDQPFTSGPFYAGALVCFLFVLGFWVVEPRNRWWVGAAAILSIFLAMGKHLSWFNYPMYDYFPGYNKFRTVTMAIFIAQLALPLMAVLTLDRLRSLTWDKETQKKLWITLGITGGLCLVLALMPSAFGTFEGARDAQMGLPEWLMGPLVEDRQDMLSGDAWRTLLFILLGTGAIILALRQTLKPYIAFLIIGGLILVDLWSLDKRYLNKSNFERKGYIEEALQPSAADNTILADKDLSYRVLNLNDPFSETRTSYFFQSLGGYSPAKIRRYQDLIENNLTTELQGLIDSLRAPGFRMEALASFRVINMLNARYIKVNEEANGVFRNPYAMGNAWFVKQVKTVSTPDEEIAALPSLDLRNEAVVDTKKFPLEKTAFVADGSTARITDNKTNHLEYDISAAGDGLLVLSEIYYPEGWVATLDGKEVPIIRANYALRALQVPAGTHKLVLHFSPKSYALGNTITLVSSLLVLGLFAGTVVLSLRGVGEAKKS